MLILVAVFFTVKILSDVFKGSSLFNEMSSYNKHRFGLLRGSLGLWWPWLIAGSLSCPAFYHLYSAGGGGKGSTSIPGKKEKGRQMKSRWILKFLKFTVQRILQLFTLFHQEMKSFWLEFTPLKTSQLSLQHTEMRIIPTVSLFLANLCVKFRTNFCDIYSFGGYGPTK